MLLQKINIVLFFLMVSVCSYAQTEIDHQIILDGTNTDDKQILNIGEPKFSHSALRPEDIKYGKFNYASVTVSGTDTLSLSFESPVSRIFNGDLFFFTIPFTNTGPLILSVQGMDTLIPLMLNTKDSVGKGRLIPGQLVGALYRNNHAYIISKTEKTCPSGFAKVNDNYCIEINERSASNFFAAATNCIEDNFELCNAGEWYYACVNRLALGLNDMINNYEWLDDAANDVLQVRALGNATCTGTGNVAADIGSLTYRCCYILK